MSLQARCRLDSDHRCGLRAVVLNQFRSFYTQSMIGTAEYSQDLATTQLQIRIFINTLRLTSGKIYPLRIAVLESSSTRILTTLQTFQGKMTLILIYLIVTEAKQ